VEATHEIDRSEEKDAIDRADIRLPANRPQRAVLVRASIVPIFVRDPKNERSVRANSFRVVIFASLRNICSKAAAISTN